MKMNFGRGCKEVARSQWARLESARLESARLEAARLEASRLEVACAEAQSRVQRLQEREKLRQGATQMMVHDMRLPLTSLLSGLRAAECLAELSEEQQECVNIAIHGGESLLGMVNDLLDIAKMEESALKLERAPVDVPSLVGDAVDVAAPLARRKGLQLHLGVAPGMPALWGDGGRLARVVENLLGNAVKFTPDGGAVSVAASFVARPGRRDSFVLSVSDTGEGVAPEDTGLIFEKFGQAHPRLAGRENSSGLGLAFCKMVAEAHGGRIWVESEVGCGSTFALAIPAGARA